MAKPKKVNFVLVEDGTEPYLILDEIRTAHHPDILDAKIALAWRKALNPDADGHLVLGKCQRTTALPNKSLSQRGFWAGLRVFGQSALLFCVLLIGLIAFRTGSESTSREDFSARHQAKSCEPWSFKNIRISGLSIYEKSLINGRNIFVGV